MSCGFAWATPLISEGQFTVGQTVPVKIDRTDAAGNVVSTASRTLSVNGGAGVPFLLHGNHRQVQLETSGLAAGPATLTVALDDGTSAGHEGRNPRRPAVG